MKISGVSNVLNNHITNTLLNKNNSPSNKNNPLEKEKAQIQKQINDVENSNLSKEEKDAKIKELEENLQEVEQKEMEEKAQKKLQNPEIESVNKKKQLENDEKLKPKDDEDNQVLNKDVVYGITSSSTHMKIGKVAYSVYKDAKNKGKTDVAQRALSYASSEFKQSRDYTKLVSKGINEYKKQLRNAKGNKNPTDTEGKKSLDNIKEESLDNEKKSSTDNTVNKTVVSDNLNNSASTTADNKNS